MIVSFPELDSNAGQWIKEFRSRYDVNFPMEPHFTLVFADTCSSVASFEKDVQARCASLKSIPFCIRGAMFMPKSFEGDFSYTFLVPDEGCAEIIRAHDYLYEGMLRPRLRLDIPYIPHMTIGTSKNNYESKRLVDELNKKKMEIRGKIEVLTLLENHHGQWTKKLDLKLS